MMDKVHKQETLLVGPSRIVLNEHDQCQCLQSISCLQLTVTDLFPAAPDFSYFPVVSLQNTNFHGKN